MSEKIVTIPRRYVIIIVGFFMLFQIIGFVLAILSFIEIRAINQIIELQSSNLVTPIPIGYSSFQPITDNSQWAPIEKEFDGIPMVLVPVGCFEMGSVERDTEQPIQQICFKEPFWIDKYEVTQSQFSRLNGQKEQPNAFVGDSRPIESITWYEAKTFCELRGLKLPSEAEWEYSSRGPSNLIYAWGNEFFSNAVVFGESKGDNAVTVATRSVGSRSDGVSWVGAFDMNGNVWEWTSSIYQPYPYDKLDGRENSASSNNRVRRGGSWSNLVPEELQSSYRNDYPPNQGFEDIGFRCLGEYTG